MAFPALLTLIVTKAPPILENVASKRYVVFVLYRESNRGSSCTVKDLTREGGRCNFISYFWYCV
jgi:hypothetical protein